MEELLGAVTPLLLLGMMPGVVQALKVWFKLQDKPAEILNFGVAATLAALWQLQSIYGDVWSFWFKFAIYTVLFGLTSAGYYKLTHPASSAKG